MQRSTSFYKQFHHVSEKLSITLFKELQNNNTLFDNHLINALDKMLSVLDDNASRHPSHGPAQTYSRCSRSDIILQK